MQSQTSQTKQPQRSFSPKQAAPSSPRIPVSDEACFEKGYN